MPGFINYYKDRGDVLTFNGNDKIRFIYDDEALAHNTTLISFTNILSQAIGDEYIKDYYYANGTLCLLTTKNNVLRSRYGGYYMYRYNSQSYLGAIED
jgi:hypothetical protein